MVGCRVPLDTEVGRSGQLRTHNAVLQLDAAGTAYTFTATVVVITGPPRMIGRKATDYSGMTTLPRTALLPARNA